MTQQYMGLGDPHAPIRALEGELDEKLRDRLRALQAREEAMLAESGEQPELSTPANRQAIISQLITGDDARQAFRAAFEEDN